MKTRCVDQLGWACVRLGISGIPSTASASATAPIDSVTDLGSGYTLQQDASGSIQGVTSGDGGRTFTSRATWASISPRD